MTPDEYRREASTELVAEGGVTRMPPTDQRWLSPVGVRPSKDGIDYLPRDSLVRGGVIVPTEGLLEDFLTLRGADSYAVAAFAVRHGVLGLPDKKWPRRRGEYGQEPLSAWHEAAARADALLSAAAKLRAGRPLSDDQRVPVLAAAWPARLRGVLDATPDTDLDEAEQRKELLMYASRTLGDDRVQLAWAVSTWMAHAGAQLVLTWPAGSTTPALAIGGEMARGCLAAITVQVALACSRGETTRTCDGCGVLHAPRRQPKPGQRSFCQQCRDAGVPVKLATRDRRAKQRQRKIGATSS